MKFNTYLNEEKLKLKGKTYTVKTFKTEEETNKFLEKNDDWGVIHEKGGKIYVAKNSDKGIKE